MICRTTQVFLVLSLCVGSAPALAADQAAKLIPLKPDMLEGSRLVLRAAGCSVDLPGPGWKWMTYEGSTGQNYLCGSSSAGALYLVAVGQLHGDLTDHQPQSLIDNARKAITTRGGKIEDDKFEWLEIAGARKCVRVCFSEVEKSGKRTLVVIYIAHTIGRVSLKLQYTGAGASEPETFKQMVGSLKRLGGSADSKPKAPSE
jgi:hypothetical protein